MALISCPECGKQVSDKAFACPNCGYPINVTYQSNRNSEDNSQRIANLYERARKSLEVGDLEHAAEYYKQILDENPNDWEAYFYSYLGEFPTFTHAQAGSVAEKLGNTIPPAYDMAIQNCNIVEATYRVKIISENFSNRLVSIATTGAALLREYEGGNAFTPAGGVYVDMYAKLRPVGVNTIVNCVLAYETIDSKLEELLNNDRIDKTVCKECLLYIRRARYQIATMQFKPSAGRTEYLIKRELIRDYAKKIQALDPNFKDPFGEPKTEAKTDFKTSKTETNEKTEQKSKWRTWINENIINLNIINFYCPGCKSLLNLEDFENGKCSACGGKLKGKKK